MVGGGWQRLAVGGWSPLAVGDLALPSPPALPPQGPALSLNKLIPKCDLVARIDNDDVPVLSALELVDRSGNWAPIRDQFAHVLPSPYEFPESMAPLFLLRTDFGAAHLRLRRGCAGATCGGDLLPPAWALLGPTCAALRLGDAGPLVFSGTRPLNISYDARAKAQIPTCAQTYAFSYALPQACEAEGLDRENPHVCFLANGGCVPRRPASPAPPPPALSSGARRALSPPRRPSPATLPCPAAQIRHRPPVGNLRLIRNQLRAACHPVIPAPRASGTQ